MSLKYDAIYIYIFFFYKLFLNPFVSYTNISFVQTYQTLGFNTRVGVKMIKHEAKDTPKHMPASPNRKMIKIINIDIAIARKVEECQR